MQADLRHVADLALFAKVVQTGGISRCARDLGIERTTVSRRLASLERDLGVKLVERSPRRITVTEAGKRCFDECERLLQAARNAETAATQGSGVIDAQPITIGAPPDVFEKFLDVKLAVFAANHPNIRFERFPASEWDKELCANVDLLISWTCPDEDIGLARQLAAVSQSVYASPEYIAEAGRPATPYELDRHSCIIESTTDRARVWEFEHEAAMVRKTIAGRYRIRGLLQARETALAGLGLVQLPDYLCSSYVKEGRLVEVLADFLSKPRELYMITPRRADVKPRATTLRMYLEDAFQMATGNVVSAP